MTFSSLFAKSAFQNITYSAPRSSKAVRIGALGRTGASGISVHCSLVRELPNSMTPASKGCIDTWLIPYLSASSFRLRFEKRTSGMKFGWPERWT